MESVLIVLVSVAASVGASLLASYIKEKGKNYATKQDIAEITRQQEGVKFLLDHRRHVTKTQYDLELSVYQKIWEAIVGLGVATSSLRPWGLVPFEPNKSKEDIKLERLNNYAVFHNIAVDLIQKKSTVLFRRGLYPSERDGSLNPS